MSWHNPALYLFLGLLTGLAALLAITYEIFRRRRKPPAIPMKVMLPLDGLNESGPWSKPMTAVDDLALPAYLKEATPLDEFLLRDRSVLARLRNRFRRIIQRIPAPPWPSRYRLRLIQYAVILGRIGGRSCIVASPRYPADNVYANAFC